ncbi:MAG: DUF1800 family protein, partial [Caldilineaceae bacterium]|nr:DUF1800 family protein [Caldilineaceae bacterium]
GRPRCAPLQHPAFVFIYSVGHEPPAARGEIDALRAWWLLRLRHTERPLAARLGVMWHNHFATSHVKVRDARLMYAQLRTIERLALGPFATLLLAMSRDPAMIVWLDGAENVNGRPNENYARELLELHTLGAENYFGVVPLQIGSDGSFQHPAPKDENGRPLLYVDADVYGATTCFTGWRVDSDTGQFAFDAGAHFPYQKLVLGQAIPDSQGIQDGYDVLRLLANHPGTARHIARKLCRRLI